MNRCKFLFLFIFVNMFATSSSFAQACSLESSFAELTLGCIQRNEAKIDQAAESNKKLMERIKILKESKAADDKIFAAELKYNALVNLQTKELAKESEGTTFFYKTGNGNLGKFIIRAAFVGVQDDLLECSLYIESQTYDGKKIHTVNTNLVIKNDGNSWNSDTTSMDNTGTQDLILKREHGRCIFKTQEASAISFGKTAETQLIEGNILLVYTAYFLFGLAVFLIMRTVFADEDRFKANLRLEDADENEKKDVPKDFVLKYSRPFFKRYFSPVVKGMKYKKKIKEKYKRPLAASGMNKFLTPEDFYAFKLFLIIGFPIVYVVGGKFLEIEVDFQLVPVLMFVGFFYPDFWIKETATKRKNEVLINMPFVVDMLALSVEAGLDFAAAIQRVIEKAPHSALVDEFEIFLKEIKVGASRAEALRGLSWRIDSLPIASFCATLIAADSVGTSNLAPILKSLSEEIRQKRSSDIEKLGAQAATKILFPMLFLILPAVVLIIAAPFIISFMGG